MSNTQQTPFEMIEEVPRCEGQNSKLALLWLSERLNLKGYKHIRMLQLATCYYPIEHILFKLNNRCQQAIGISTDVTKLTERGKIFIEEGKNHIKCS